MYLAKGAYPWGRRQTILYKVLKAAHGNDDMPALLSAECGDARRCIYFEVQVLFFAPSCPVADTLPQEVQYKVEVLT